MQKSAEEYSMLWWLGFTCAAGSEKLPDTDHGRWKDMAPQDDEKMLPSKVTAVIKNVMEGYLQD